MEIQQQKKSSIMTIDEAFNTDSNTFFRLQKYNMGACSHMSFEEMLDT
ncbi:hypothetical protein [Guptibacillus hwajinpoensis]